uniref:GARP complex subunit n=1 Tax=uncultured bacterium 35A20 TaxID=1194347 RepID=K7PDB8_9BACT|nr:GARP complex subunit [uncultured bacterium 35A20]
MKRIILVLVVFLAASAFAFAGGGAQKSGGGSDLPPYIVDLSTLTVIQEVDDALTGEPYQAVKNKTPLTRRWGYFVVLFSDLPANITEYQRVCVKIKYYDADGNEMKGADSTAQLAMFYELKTEKSADGMHKDGNANLVFKEPNVGGFSGLLDKDRGVRIRLKQAPAGILLQAAQNEPKYIEVTAIVFHNGDYSSEE